MQRHDITCSLAAIVVCAAVLCASGALSAQSRDPFVGTCRINAAQSRFGGGATPYKESTITIEAVSKGQKVVVDTMSAGGVQIEYEFTAAFDGEDSPLTGGAPGTVTLTRVDARTVERVHTTDRKPTMRFVTRVSADGKTLTVNQTGTGPTGPVDNTLVYERK